MFEKQKLDEGCHDSNVAASLFRFSFAPLDGKEDVERRQRRKMISDDDDNDAVDDDVNEDEDEADANDDTIDATDSMTNQGQVVRAHPLGVASGNVPFSGCFPFAEAEEDHTGQGENATTEEDESSEEEATNVTIHGGVSPLPRLSSRQPEKEDADHRMMSLDKDFLAFGETFVKPSRWTSEHEAAWLTLRKTYTVDFRRKHKQAVKNKKMDRKRQQLQHRSISVQQKRQKIDR
jgi:hypothetical protein